MRIAVLVVLLATLSSAAAQDDYKVIKLEQDVRNLERQVQDLQRQVGDLRRLSQSGDASSLRSEHSAPPSAAPSTSWLVAANWDRVRAGMSELQVIDILGPPTSMRAAASSRTLFYAMEIGTSGFLGGNVRLEDRKVVEVSKPALR
jgi:hypothetical protein